MFTIVCVSRIREVGGKAFVQYGRAAAAYTLSALLAIAFVAGIVDCSWARSFERPIHAQFVDGVFLSLKNSNPVAAIKTKRMLPKGYGVQVNSTQTVSDILAEQRLSGGGNVPGGPLNVTCRHYAIIGNCRELIGLLGSKHDAWPVFAGAASPRQQDAKVLTNAWGMSSRQYAPGTGIVIVGAASMYNPYLNHETSHGAQTASGELYDPIGWTAAIQIDLRGEFGGVHYGRNYRPAYALVEIGGKQAIVKINDVGPLRPGRIIDFSQQAMHYFDPSLRRGVIEGALVTPLAGNYWTPGPIGRTQAMNVADLIE